MNPKKNIDHLLRSQQFERIYDDSETVYQYANGLAMVENCIVVVSDLKANTSRIFNGKFSDVLGLSGMCHENSIWETEIIEKMSNDEQEKKYISELRFFNFLRKIPIKNRKDYYMVSHLRFLGNYGKIVDVMHRMYYWYDCEIIRYGICLYSPMTLKIPYKSIAVNSITGDIYELTHDSDSSILSRREKQVLCLIEMGFTSQAIADKLCISKHTVSRHRQEILSKLQARNSMEACKRGKLLKII